MIQITVDCGNLETKAQLHTALSDALNFPEWYGHNLDALYDCLTDLEESVHLHLAGWDRLPEWKAAFASVFNDAESDCMELIISYE